MQTSGSREPFERSTTARNLVVLASITAMALTACSVADRFGDDGARSATASSPASIRANVGPGKVVPVDRRVTISATSGTLQRVVVRDGAGRVLPGRLNASSDVWQARELLEPGTRYQARVSALGGSGEQTQEVRRFRTADLSLDDQTFASIAPVAGETVGVGMPVVVNFDVAVSDRAAIERKLQVTSQPAQAGAWHWISDNEVHYRPRNYWKPGTKVTVDAAINSVHAGNGVYGQESRRSSFTVGDSVIMKVDVANHVMDVYRNGSLARSIPISAGKPGFTTRSGIKVIVEKFRSKRMDAATTGISPGDAEYYNIDNVEYAQRVTYSGEFIHAAPWSVGSQGNANVSHGCVGMSTDNAAWLYSVTKRGDVVDVTGTDRQMEFTNGYGDWNVSFAEYRRGSALG